MLKIKVLFCKIKVFKIIYILGVMLLWYILDRMNRDVLVINVISNFYMYKIVKYFL